MVSEEEAEKLLIKALEKGGASKLPHFTTEPGYTNPDFPDFFFFLPLHYAPEPGGVAVIGTYAVDKRTGDVWDGAVCSELETHGLRKLQKSIRNRIGLSEQEYKQTRRLGPMCDPRRKTTQVKARMPPTERF
jgi:hypothetical protein